MNRVRLQTLVRWMPIVVLFASHTVGCGLEVGSEGEDDALDVGVNAQALHGSGQTFWLAKPGERPTTIRYCFVGLPASVEAVRTPIFQSLQNTWAGWANLSFQDDGDCSSQKADPDNSIRIVNADVNDPTITPYFPQAHSRFGTSGISDPNLRTMPSMWLPISGTGAAFACSSGSTQMSPAACMRMVAPHEFGHALGFHHEHNRGGGCMAPDPMTSTADIAPNTNLTDYDNDSLLERGYCSPAVSPASLSALDKAGVQAIYGYGGGGTVTEPQVCKAPGCAYARYMTSNPPSPAPAFAVRFQLGGVWLKPNDTHGVESQTYIGAWERIRFYRVSGQSNDGYVHYGDTIAIKDRWGYYLSARENGRVEMRSFFDDKPQDWEKWVVEYPNAPPNGRVFINMPVRLRSFEGPAKGKYLVQLFGSVSTGSSTDGNIADLRFNGSIPL